MPNKDRKYWCSTSSAIVPSLPSGRRGGIRSNAIMSPATAATRWQSVSIVLCTSVMGHQLTMLVPEPFSRSLVSGHAACAVRTQQLILLFRGHIRQTLGETRSDDDHIARLELNALFLGYLLDVIGGKRVSIVRVELYPFLVGVTLVVDEDTSGDKPATLVPVVQRGNLLVTVLVTELLRQFFGAGLNAIVAFGTFLMVNVAQTVPLA